MVTMNISLPDDMKAFVDAEVQRRGFASSSEYVRALIREQREVEEFRAKIHAGIDAGPGLSPDEVLAHLRAKVKAAE